MRRVKVVRSRAANVRARAIVVAAVIAPTAALAQNYTVTDLGTLGTGNESFAYAINDAGQVAGWSRITNNGFRHGFRWTSGTMQDLGTLAGKNESFAYGINDFGVVVGRSANSSDNRAFLWSPITTPQMLDLGTLGGSTAEAWAINNNGIVVGRSATGSAERAFRWVSGAITMIPGTLSQGDRSYAYGINDAGVVVGYASTNNQNNEFQAWRWTGTGNIVGISNLGGTDSYAYDVNASGQIAGPSDTTNDLTTSAYRWNTTFTNLGTLGGLEAEGWGINDAGHVVGYSTYLPNTTSSNGPTHAFLATGATMVDLNDVIDPSSGWVLTDARDINNLGQIVGKGSIGGQTHAFMLTPSPAWANAAGGGWSTAGNWTPAAVPATSAIARFDLNSVGGYNVTFNANTQIGIVSVQTDKPAFNLSNRTLTVSNNVNVGMLASQTGQLSLSNGTLSAPNVYLGGNAGTAGGSGVLNVNSGATLNVSGTIKVWDSGTTQLTLNGGTISAGAIDVNGNTARFVGNGTTTGWVAGTLELTNSSVVIGTSGILGSSLTLPANKTLRIKTNSQYVQIESGASVAFTGGKIDITNKKLIATAGDVGSWNGTNYTGITGLVQAGRNGGSWNGSGIITSVTTAAGATALTTLGVATASETGISSFGGVGVSGSDVLVKYTYTGDANLSGLIDGDDFARIDAGYSANSTGWINGDFNYDGTIDADDYFLIDRGYSRQDSQFSNSEVVESVTAVPEPAGTTLAIVGTAALLRRRRRG